MITAVFTQLPTPAKSVGFGVNPAAEIMTEGHSVGEAVFQQCLALYLFLEGPGKDKQHQ